MSITVSVSQLRNNISLYLEKAMQGTQVLVRDDKKDKAIAQITQMKSFDKDSYEKALRKAAGIFTAENHPEWETKSDVIRWLEKSRLADERSF